MPTYNWEQMRHVAPFALECDAIEASIIMEAAQAHDREMGRKVERLEASKEAGKHHALAIIAADRACLAEFVRRLDKTMQRAVAVEIAQRDKVELFSATAPRAAKEAA